MGLGVGLGFDPVSDHEPTDEAMPDQVADLVRVRVRVRVKFRVRDWTRLHTESMTTSPSQVKALLLKSAAPLG